MFRSYFIICLVVFSAGILRSGAANDIYSRSDPFELGNLVEVHGNLMWDWNGTRPGYFDVRDIFGGEYGTGENNGNVAYKDEVIPADLNDWVEWETAAYVPLEKYQVILAEETISALPQRQATRVNLLAVLDETNLFTLVDSFVPNYDQVTGNTILSTAPRTLANRVVAKKWRLEMTREPMRQFGIRIIELDAIQTTPINSYPQVTITNVEENAVFLSDQNIQVGVDATADEGIWRVEFFVDNELYESRKQNFNFTWGQPEAGEHLLVVKAYDRLGTETSNSVRVFVEDREVLARISQPRIGAGFIHFDVDNGVFAKEQVLYSSMDLLNWSPVATNRYSGEPWTFSQPLSTGQTRFYKVGNRSVEPPLPGVVSN